MKIRYLIWVASIMVVIILVVNLLAKPKEFRISSDSFFIGDFIVTSKPEKFPNLGVFKSSGGHDLFPFVDPPIKIIGLHGKYAYAEKVFSISGDWDLTRDLVKPHVDLNAERVYVAIPLTAGEGLRWFSDSRFKTEITHLIENRYAAKAGPPQNVSEPRK